MSQTDMKLPTLEQQVCTIEQAQELQSYGVPEGALCSVADPDGKRDIVMNDEYAYEMSHMNPCPVWTLSELLYISPQTYRITKVLDGFLVTAQNGNSRSCQHAVSGIADLIIELLKYITAEPNR